MQNGEIFRGGGWFATRVLRSFGTVTKIAEFGSNSSKGEIKTSNMNQQKTKFTW